MAKPTVPIPLSLAFIQHDGVLILTSGLLRRGPCSSQWPWTHNLFEDSPASEIQPTRPVWAGKEKQIIHDHSRTATISHVCGPQVIHSFTQSHSEPVIGLCLKRQPHLVKGQKDPALMMIQKYMCIYRSTDTHT